eukprot:NODE_590_length_2043_cov_48.411273_g548_i0.p1 GENE.NODE_590_length_2043_cov_48.411273_g548_i0~~NODE_590_length_2043_cov_48.411273_g548_i0.p1  ORF type:complete len:606 (+),score=220.16 NODE_590_length_2043_cov_48.411273_g548_i0:118-1935(+)
MAASLLHWIQTFPNLTTPCTSLADLTDGVLLSELLAQIAPRHFETVQAKKETNGNWVLKTNNIKRICKGLERFYAEKLGCALAIGDIVDAVKLGRDQDEGQVITLAELVLTTLYGSDRRERLVERIQSMDQQDQFDLMEIMQGSSQKYGVNPMFYEELTSPSKATLEDNEDYYSRVKRVEPPPPRPSRLESMRTSIHTSLQQTEMSQLTQQIEQLRGQLKAKEVEHTLLMEDHRQLKAEKEGLSRKLSQQLDSRLAPTSSSPDTAVGRPRVDLVYGELEQRDRSIQELQGRVLELCGQLEATSGLQDEIDILQTKLLDYSKLESKLEGYNKKVEEVNELRRALQREEDQSERYLDKHIELERCVAERAAELAKAQTQITALTVEVAAMRAQAEDRQRRLEGRHSETAALEAELQIVREREARGQEQIRALMARLEDLEEGTPKSDGELHELTDYRQYKEKWQRAEREQQRLKQDLAECTEKYERHLSLLRAEKQRLAESPVEPSEVRQLQATVAQLRAELSKCGYEEVQFYKKKYSDLERLHRHNLQEFEQHWNEAKQASQLEQKLIVSTFYDLGMQNLALHNKLQQSFRGAKSWTKRADSPEPG